MRRPSPRCSIFAAPTAVQKRRRGAVRDERELNPAGMTSRGGAAGDGAPRSRFSRLREALTGPRLSFLMEAHNGLSAKIAEEAGFEALWASGLTISASLGLRDSNEAS